MKKFLSCCLLGVLWVCCSTASAATFGYSLQRCKNIMRSRPPQIDVVYSYGSLRLDNSKDAEGIKEIFQQLHPEQATHKVNGLTVMSPHAAVENSISMEFIDEYLCYYPERVTINTGYHPTVYISKELTSNPCRFMLTVRHEQTHLDIGHLSLQNFAKRLKEEFPKIVESVGPRLKSQGDSVVNADDVAKEINAEYLAQLKVLFDDFVQKLLEENARIDTDENYETEKRLCPDN